MTTVPLPDCRSCKHLRMGGVRGPPTCDAFPGRIPRRIWNGLDGHRGPYPGDGGIQYEPMENGGNDGTE